MEIFVLSHFKWTRVSKEFPCTVCGRTDWDTYCSELGLACCMRVSSERPSKNGGFLHYLNAGAQKPIPIKEPPPKPTINATKLMRDFACDPCEDKICRLASSLGVACDSLRRTGCVWARPHQAFAFPMKDGYGNTVGIRLRSESGKKWAVTGSRQGIFIPERKPEETAFIVEGPTDLAAALTLGLFAIGLPSCMGGNDQVKTVLKRFDCRRAILVCDNDDPGVEGAKRLSSELHVPNCIVNPPSKDLREFLNLGGTKELLLSMIQSLIWKNPK